MNRTRRALAATALATAVALSGCGVQNSIVHLQPAPTENVETGAPLRLDAAERIATRVLGNVAAAATTEERSQYLVGPALRVEGMRAERGLGSEESAPELVVPSAPTILAMSQGQDWPRAILAATLDEGTSVQHVHVLISSSATDQFKLFATAMMLPGTSIPVLGEVQDGATVEAATGETPIAASELFTQYAQGIAYPEPAEVTAVTIQDPYAESLRRNAKAQADALGDLAKLTQTHAPVADTIVSFTAADGSMVAFGQLVRTDRIVLTDKAKELNIPDEPLQKLSGKKVVTKEFLVESLENLLLVSVRGEPAQLVGAEEIVQRATGS